MKFDVQSIFNSFNDNFIAIYNQDIIDIKRYNDFFFEIHKHIIVRFDKIKTEFLHINRKMLILNLKKLF